MLRHEVLHACAAVSTAIGRDPARPASGGDQDFGAVRGQASQAAAWHAHPFKPEERLLLAETLVRRGEELGLAMAAASAACDVYARLLEPEALFGPRSDGTARCAVVFAAGEAAVAAAAAEVVELLLRGYAVSLAAPAGPAHDAAANLVEGFPAELLQVVEEGPLSELPVGVQAVRHVGGNEGPARLWRDVPPPPDFGGRSADNRTHGACATPGQLSLARADVARLARLPRSRYVLSQESMDLMALLSTSPEMQVQAVPGLTPPRWARSPYDRGVEEVHDLLDLLYLFSAPLAVSGASGGFQAAALASAPKHLMLTKDTSDIPADIAKAAVLSAASPFREQVTLHAVGLGAKFLSKDPYRSFCRLVQSGRSGLEWKVQEHDTWEDFNAWLESSGEAETAGSLPATFFGRVPGAGSEVELRRRTACAGGIAWASMFPADPVEQLRRWCRPAVATAGSEKEALAALEKQLHRTGEPPLEIETVVPAPEQDAE